jgi:PhnB protein
MAYAIPYLTLPGTCERAMRFYQSVFGGDITIMQTLADSGMDVAEDKKDKIFNSELRAGGFVLKASDISIFVVFPDAATKRDAFTRLADGGEVVFPLDEHFGMVKDAFTRLADGGEVVFPLDEHFGMVKDAFGVSWMVIHEAGALDAGQPLDTQTTVAFSKTLDRHVKLVEEGDQ